MRIIGITTVRNEEDIIEAFARHALAVCTELLVMNHGSTDLTLDILQALQQEGLPITVVTDATFGDLQSVYMNRLMHMAVHDFAADWVVCLDADEFIQGPLVEHLRKHWVKEEGQCYRIRLVNYRAHPEDRIEIINPAERITYHEAGELRPEPLRASKVLFSRALVLKEGAFLEKGNHQFTISGFPVPFQWIDEVSLAHYPLRSPGQFGTKVVSRILQKFTLRLPNTGTSDHYETPYQEIQKSYTAFSKKFYQNRASWVSSIKEGECLVQQPARYLGGELRYPCNSGELDLFIRNTLNLAESLASSNSSSGSNVDLPTRCPEISVSLCSPTGSDHLNLRTYPASSTTFSSLSLSLKEGRVEDRIHIGIRTGTGVLEIGEITVKYVDGHAQTFLPDEIESLLSVDCNGLKLHNPAFVRVLVGMRPIVITLAGAAVFARGIPMELILKARLLTDNQRMALAVYNTQAIRQINTSFTSNASHKVQYSLSEELFFGERGYGPLYLRSGWSKPQDWGTWSDGAFSSIALTLKLATKKPLALRIQLRRRKGVPVKLSINVDQKRVGTLVLESNASQWVDLAIPADRNGRAALDLSFQLEPTGKISAGGHLGFGIKRLILRQESSLVRSLKASRRFFKRASGGSPSPALHE